MQVNKVNQVSQVSTFLGRLTAVLLAVFACSIVCSSQSYEANPKPFRHYTFTKDAGYLIDKPYAMERDSLGWMWLAGIKLEASNFQLGDNEAIIQRFDGHSFHTMPLPDPDLKESHSIFMKKRTDDLFYVEFNTSEDEYLYLLDPFDLEFRKVSKPSEDVESFHIFKFGEEFLYCANEGYRSAFYTLDNDRQFKFLAETIPLGDFNNTNILVFDDHFIISGRGYGALLFQRNGTFVHKYDHSTFPSLKLNGQKIYFNTAFRFNGKTYARFSYANEYFQYAEQQRTWISSSIFDSSSTSFSGSIYADHTYVDEKEHIVHIRLAEGEAVLQGYLEELEPLFWLKLKQSSPIPPIVFSRDLEKELLAAVDNTLHVFLLNPPNVDSYLKPYSIRSIYPVNEHDAIVATENNGWFQVNLDLRQEKRFGLLKNGLAYMPKLNRNILTDHHGYWSNDEDGLMLIPAGTRNVVSFPNMPRVSAMTQDVQNIYFGSHDHNLMKFDKSTHEMEVLMRSDSLDFMDLILVNDTLCAATDKGLLLCVNGKTSLYRPDSLVADHFLLSVDYYPTHGILVGTRTGELLEFLPSSEEFYSIYKDELEASIASTLIDDRDQIWINTFAGIVTLDSQGKKIHRFGTEVGLSHFEANRHSALKMPDGRFLTGTLKGVNYFHPDSLQKERSTYKLELTSLAFFQKSKDSLVTIYSPKELRQIEKVEVPTELRNLDLGFGLLGTFFTENLRFRYRLNPDQSWVNLNNVSNLRLINLAPGKYQLEIETIDLSGEVIGNTLSLKVISHEVFHKTVWFTILVVLGTSLLFLAFFLFWKRLQWASFRNTMLQSEIEYKKKDLADFAMDIARNQKWRVNLLDQISNLKKVKGQKKDALISVLEGTVRDQTMVDESSSVFQKKVDVLNNEFYSRLLQSFPDLTKNEIRLCSLIRLNLENADIAVLQHVAPESVYKSRSRLRKKLGLTPDVDLNVYLKKF